MPLYMLILYGVMLDNGCWRLTVEKENGPTNTGKETLDFLKARKWNIPEWSNQPPDLNQMELLFSH